MSKKLLYEDIRSYIADLGYELISKEYKNNWSKLIIKDKYGYYYTVKLNNLKSGYFPCIVEKRNPHTIQNIKLWCQLNNKPFVLLSEEYKGRDEKLKWKCLKEECGEIFNTSWHSILSKEGCSYCAGRNIGLSNCLATKNPILAKEWHPTRNGDLTSNDVTCSTDKKVWWLCSKGHEWQANIASRNQGKNCPYCAGNLPSEENNLLVCNPKLCEEWDYENNKNKPEEYSPNSNKKVW
jgi:TusA-related sulfurtransferase